MFSYLGTHPSQLDQAQAPNRAGTVCPRQAVNQHIAPASECRAHEGDERRDEGADGLGRGIYRLLPIGDVESEVRDRLCTGNNQGHV